MANSIIAGNDFRLIIRAKKSTGAYLADMDLADVEDLRIYLTRAGRSKVLQSYTLDEEGHAVIYVSAGVVTNATYGIEMVGVYGGARLRAHNTSVFTISGHGGGNSGVLNDYYADIVFVINVAATDVYVQNAIEAHNEDEASHPHLLQLIEDAGDVDDVQIDGESIVDENKIAKIDSSQFGKVDDVKVNGTSVVSNKEANITMPEKVSDLPNDAEYATKSELTTGLAVKQDTITAVVDPTIADDGGNPSASVDFEGGEMAFAFKNLKLRFSDLTAADKAELKGGKGDQGDSAVYDPSSPDVPDFVMANTTGQSTTKAMTQKAVTDTIESVNKPYKEPVVIQDSFSSFGTASNNTSYETMSEEDGVYTYNRITTYSGCGFYIGPIDNYDYTKQHYLRFDYTFANAQVGNNTYIKLRKGKLLNSVVFAESTKYSQAGSGSGYIKLPKTNPSATLYIVVICSGVPTGNAGVVLSNIRLVKEDDTTIPEKIGELEEELNNIPTQIASGVESYVNEHYDNEPVEDSENLMLSGGLYNAFDKANHPFREPVVIQDVFGKIGYTDSRNEITFTENDGVYTLTRTGTTGSGRCWIGALNNYDLSKTTKLVFDAVLADNHVANYTKFEVRTTPQESGVLCGRTTFGTKGTHHIEILLDNDNRGKYFGFQYTGIPKHSDGSAVLTISNIKLIQYDNSTIPELLNDLLGKTDNIDLSAPQIAKSNDVDKTKNLFSQFTRVIGTNTIKPLVILHFSDLHGCDENISRINQYRTYYREFIDVAIHTGDLIQSSWSDDTDFYFGNEENADILNVVGNHDVVSYYGGAYHADHIGKDCYDRFFDPFIGEWNVVQPEDASENGYCWYYKDFTANNIRLIVIDVMNNIEAQRTWFSDVLEDARTQGLHVIAAAHYRFTGGSNIDSVFTQRGTTTTPETYIDNDYLMMVKTFKDNGGNFICWLNGHHHADAIQKSSDATGNQLAFNANTSGNGEQVKNSPINRVAIDRNIDAFNIIAVDTIHHVVSLFKVGSEFDKWGRRFGTFCINYQTNDIIWND